MLNRPGDYDLWTVQLDPSNVHTQSIDYGLWLLYLGIPFQAMLDQCYSASWHRLYEHGKDHRPWMKLCAVASQWFWTYQLSSSLSHLVTDCYLVRSDGLRTGQVRVLEPDNNLILPYNRWLRLLISGVAVIHSFGVHSLGLKLDGIPGRLSSS